jgi:hypothetical protein
LGFLIHVLSERFIKDGLGDYFGHEQAEGGHCDNPTAQQFGYNDLTIAAHAKRHCTCYQRKCELVMNLQYEETKKPKEVTSYQVTLK